MMRLRPRLVRNEKRFEYPRDIRIRDADPLILDLKDIPGLLRAAPQEDGAARL